MVAYKAACHILSNAFLTSLKTWYIFCLCWRYFHIGFRDWRSILWCFFGSKSSLLFSSYLLGLCLSLFKMTFNMTLLQSCGLLFLGNVIISDWVHGVGHSPVLQILLQISVKTSVMVSPPAWTSSAGILSNPTDVPFLSAATENLNFLTKNWL